VLVLRSQWAQQFLPQPAFGAVRLIAAFITNAAVVYETISYFIQFDKDIVN